MERGKIVGKGPYYDSRVEVFGEKVCTPSETGGGGEELGRCAVIN